LLDDCHDVQILPSMGNEPMRKRHLLFWFLILATMAMPASAQHLSGKSKIDLERLVQLYMIPIDANYNVLEWATGSAPDTPIVWQHSGIKDCGRLG
jgi:hypothetical protein